MRKRTIVVCGVAAMALALGVGGMFRPAASFAQRPPAQPDSDTERAVPAYESALPMPGGLAVPDSTLQPILNHAARVAQPPSGLQALLAEDPLRAAEQFVEKTAAEMRDAIDVLGNEAQSLRARLQNVEAAQQRLQAALRALETAGAPAMLEDRGPIGFPIDSP